MNPIVHHSILIDKPLLINLLLNQVLNEIQFDFLNMLLIFVCHVVENVHPIAVDSILCANENIEFLYFFNRK